MNGLQTTGLLFEKAFLDDIVSRTELKHKANQYLDLILNRKMYMA